MAPLDLGIGQEAMEALGRIKPLDDGTYEFVIERPELNRTDDGRPMWVLFLRVVNNANIPNRSIRYGVVIPHQKVSGELDYGTWPGFGLPLCVEIGLQVNYAQFPDQDDLPWVKANFEGKSGWMQVGHKARKGEPDIIDNTVRFPKWENYRKNKGKGPIH